MEKKLCPSKGLFLNRLSTSAALIRRGAPAGIPAVIPAESLPLKPYQVKDLLQQLLLDERQRWSLRMKPRAAASL